MQAQDQLHLCQVNNAHDNTHTHTHTHTHTQGGEIRNESDIHI